MHLGLKRTPLLPVGHIITVFNNASGVTEEVVLKHFHTISSNEIPEWMNILRSPAFNDAPAGTHKYISSAEWTASKLSERGIQPARLLYRNFEADQLNY